MAVGSGLWMHLVLQQRACLGAGPAARVPRLARARVSLALAADGRSRQPPTADEAALVVPLVGFEPVACVPLEPNTRQCVQHLAHGPQH